MSSSSSESDTLLPSHQGSELDMPSPQHQIDAADRPIRFSEFMRNVRLCKSLLAATLPGAVGVEIAYLLVSLASDWRGQVDSTTKEVKTALLGGIVSDAIGVGLTAIVTLLFLWTLVKPISTPLPGQKPKNIGLHHWFCGISFVSFLASLILHAAPSVLYTIFTHLTAPVLVGTPFSLVTLGHARTVILTVNFIIAGCIRRGPQLYYQPMRMITGFGLSAEGEQIKKKTVDGDPEASDMQEEEVSNVFDYTNCSMLSFVCLYYISPLARQSMIVPQLSRHDLPHLEGTIRQSGLRYMTFSDEEGGKVRLDNSPIGPTSASRKNRTVGQTFTQWTLLQATWSGRGWIIITSLLLDAFKTSVTYLQIVSMHEIINTFYQPPGSDKAYARLMCWGLFFGQTVDVFLASYLWVRENYLLHLPTRMTLASILFSKILRTADARAAEAHNSSDNDRDSTNTSGRSQVMNLLTIDTGTIASLATLAPVASNGVISLTIGIGFLYSMLGVSAIVGIACIPLAAPLSAYVARNIYRCDKAWASSRDARIAAIKEFLLGIKVIKLNAFEDYFKRNIERLRDNEVVWQRWRFTLGTLFNILADQLPILAILITFFVHTKIFHRPLEPATAFVALGVFNKVKESLSMIPNVLQAILMTKVSLGRLISYLNQPEIEETTWDTSDLEVVCDRATIGWPGTAEADAEALTAPFKLRNVDFTIPQGKFTLVCGVLGSGKTLLLRALLGEARIEEGAIRSPRSTQDATPLDGAAITGEWTEETWLDSSVAYAPQQSFIRHGTVRDNITFGQPFWRARYREALRQASLVSDLDIMQDGDRTEVGDKGVNLSGGQKARINLARCLYSRARTVYMDDILSAVDAHTSHFIVQECLAGGLLKGRTVVLVTHHVGLCLPVADFVISLSDGYVDQACPASEVKLSVIAAQLPEPEEELTEEEQPLEKALSKPKKQDEEQQHAAARNVYTVEKMAVGQVDSSHYLLVFAAAGGFWFWFLLAILYGGARGLDIAQVLWLRRWSSDSDPHDLDLNLGVYAILVTGGVGLGAIRWVWLYGLGSGANAIGFYNRGSRRIHKQLLDQVCAAPLSFFETTPNGRIMNIFGQDFARLDGSIADDFGRTVSAFLDVGTSALIVCLQAPYLLLFFIAFGGPVYWLSRMLRKLRADLRRLSATAGSPLISLYHDTIDGVVMTRAFGCGELMCATMIALINRERQTTLADWTVFNWIRGVIQSVAAIIVTATGFFLINQDISPAQAGFLLSFAVTSSQGLYTMLTTYSGLEQTFVSAERVNQYVEMPFKEETSGSVPPKSWPAKGGIRVKNLCVKYHPELPDVLHDVSFNVEPGMRVGLVGATGSGKSTLALCLFRAMEARAGSIEIDGTDIHSVQLKELRKRLNMVVQDGSLGSGTLRDALDITQTKDDYEVYEALRRVHLLPEDVDPEALKENPFANLETFVAVEGANFSQGQRQLLCLARALLKKSKILVMDEATSSVDFEMDAKITATIKECFAETTMLVIAHRLATIMHYDRVLVLDKGKVLEYGRPRDLMQEGASAFRALCMAQGKEEFDRLVEMTLDEEET